MKVVVVIPTYNEKENVERILPILEKVFSKVNHDCHALFVDGNSSDGTVGLLKSFSKKYSFAHVLVEKRKEGLGSAYVKGFKRAISKMKADVVMEMDGDMQHDPSDIPRFLKEIDNGYDYVLGSRFIAGGGVPNEWELYRKFLSWGGSVFTRLVLGLFKISDFTTGYKATRVKGVLDKIPIDEVLSKGFAYKIDLLYKTHKTGAKIKEIPIIFGLRDRGDSKMEKGNFIESLKVVLLIRYMESRSFFRFVLVGFAGMFTDVLVANVLRVTPLSSTFSAVTAAFVAMIVTFTLNNTWSFSEEKISGGNKIVRVFIVYVLFSSVPIVFRYFIVDFFIKNFGDTFIYYNLALFVSIAVGIVWNYTMYSKIIWRKNKK